jgi:hypothetical protein
MSRADSKGVEPVAAPARTFSSASRSFRRLSYSIFLSKKLLSTGSRVISTPGCTGPPSAGSVMVLMRNPSRAASAFRSDVSANESCPPRMFANSTMFRRFSSPATVTYSCTHVLSVRAARFGSGS